MLNLFREKKNMQIFPQGRKQILLILMGAMYHESEVNCLDNIIELYGDDYKKNPNINQWSSSNIREYKEDLEEEFCTLDKNYDVKKERKNGIYDILIEDWGVKDKKSALDTLSDLRNYGQRKYFQKILDNFEELKNLDLQNIENFFNQCIREGIINEDEIEFDQIQDGEDEEYIINSEFIYELKKKIEYIDKIKQLVPVYGILAWDMARYSNLVRTCFIAGYLTDQESWCEIDKIADICFTNFKDWNTFVRSFMIGRHYWAGEDDEDCDEGPSYAAKRLLEHPLSPWVHFPWTRI